jgi:hypothetical protein
LQDLTGVSDPDEVLPDYVDASYFASQVLGFQQAGAAGQQQQQQQQQAAV